MFPGCTSATDYHTAYKLGLRVLKFFPAEQSGGLAKIKALAAPFSMFKIMPVSPEAAEGGPIALVEEDDLIHIDIPARKLEIVGIHGQPMSPEEVDAVLAQRRAAWQPKEAKYPSGVLKIFSQHAVSPMKGGYME